MRLGLRECFGGIRGARGSRRVTAELKAGGVSIGRHRVRRLMTGGELKAIQPRSLVPPTADSRHSLGYAAESAAADEAAAAQA